MRQITFKPIYRYITDMYGHLLLKSIKPVMVYVENVGFRYIYASEIDYLLNSQFDVLENKGITHIEFNLVFEGEVKRASFGLTELIEK